MAFGLPSKTSGRTPRRRSKRRNPTPWADRFDSGYGPRREEKPIPTPARVKVEEVRPSDWIFMQGTNKRPWQVEQVFIGYRHDTTSRKPPVTLVIFRNSQRKEFEPRSKVDMVDGRDM